MIPTLLRDGLSQYAACMRELRLRLESTVRVADSIRAALHLHPTLSDDQVVSIAFAIEQMALSLRKATELVVLSSLVANREKYESVRAEFSTDWNARRIASLVERLNASWFPQPFRLDAHLRMRNVDFVYMSKERLFELHGQCSEWLHARNPYAPALRLRENFAELDANCGLLVNLVRMFEVELYPDGYRYFVSLNMNSDESPSVALANVDAT